MEQVGTNGTNLYYLVNEEGEIVREIPSSSVERISKNDIYIKRDSPEDIDPVERVKYNYLKFNKEACDEVLRVCPQFYYLVKYINFKENALRFSNGTYVTPTSAAKALGFTNTYMLRVFTKLKKYKIIAKLKKDRRYIYVVNPYIVMCGAGVKKTTKECFQKTEWEALAYGKGKLNEPEE